MLTWKRYSVSSFTILIKSCWGLKFVPNYHFHKYPLNKPEIQFFWLECWTWWSCNRLTGILLPGNVADAGNQKVMDIGIRNTNFMAKRHRSVAQGIPDYLSIIIELHLCCGMIKSTKHHPHFSRFSVISNRVSNR